MQFISYDSDDASEKDVSPVCSAKINSTPQIPKPDTIPQSWTLNESSSDDDSVDDELNVSALSEAVSKSNKSNLLDAELLFATTSSKPKFLSRNIEEKFEVGTVKQHSYDKPDSIPSDNSNKTNVTSSSAAKSAAKNPVSVKPLTSKPEPAISEADLALKKKLDDRETAKDRVKRQRLAGQSGVGSDFREWRSEEEMRQRQMFD